MTLAVRRNAIQPIQSRSRKQGPYSYLCVRRVGEKDLLPLIGLTGPVTLGWDILRLNAVHNVRKFTNKIN